MRRLTAVLLMFLTLTACGGKDEVPEPPAQEAAHVTPAPVRPAPVKGSSLSCGAAKVVFPAMPEGMAREGSFTRLRSLSRPLRVRGVTWRESDEEVRVGVVCGVRTAEQFATLVSRSSLTVYRGRPALRWNTRGGLRNFMWLERPGTAVYIATTPGLATEIRPIAAGVTMAP
ncbi:hypothetical protein ABZ897_56475 [Nonomuraea sp. NPDC046802]|uniref:hypothetical protein n=1 Tax=Nonomuraea sp. NPDC046802 TaxID=3154919 RepID=UPI0033DDCA23